MGEQLCKTCKFGVRDNATFFRCEKMGGVMYSDRQVDCDCYESKHVTNGDRIRQMSNEEIVKFLGFSDEENELRCPPGQKICAEDCQKCWLDWFNKECEDAE